MPRNAYWIFLDENRTRFEIELQGVPAGVERLSAVAKNASERWRLLPAQERNRYESRATKEQMDYEALLAMPTGSAPTAKPPEYARIASRKGVGVDTVPAATREKPRQGASKLKVKAGVASTLKTLKKGRGKGGARTMGKLSAMTNAKVMGEPKGKRKTTAKDKLLANVEVPVALAVSAPAAGIEDAAGKAVTAALPPRHSRRSSSEHGASTRKKLMAKAKPKGNVKVMGKFGVKTVAKKKGALKGKGKDSAKPAKAEGGQVGGKLVLVDGTVAPPEATVDAPAASAAAGTPETGIVKAQPIKGKARAKAIGKLMVKSMAKKSCKPNVKSAIKAKSKKAERLHAEAEAVEKGGTGGPQDPNTHKLAAKPKSKNAIAKAKACARNVDRVCAKEEVGGKIAEGSPLATPRKRATRPSIKDTIVKTKAKARARGGKTDKPKQSAKDVAANALVPPSTREILTASVADPGDMAQPAKVSEAEPALTKSGQDAAEATSLLGLVPGGDEAATPPPPQKHLAKRAPSTTKKDKVNPLTLALDEQDVAKALGIELGSDRHTVALDRNDSIGVASM